MSWAKDAKDEISKSLKTIFHEDRVITEWRSYGENQDWLKFNEVYSPYPDIAVKPFNIHPNSAEDRNRIITEFENNKKFFQNLYPQISERIKHNNPRCLLAVEIEGSGKGKWIIGDIINASILGYIGIVVVKEELWQDANRVKNYLDGANLCNKTNLSVSNVIITQFEDLCEKMRG